MQLYNKERDKKYILVFLIIGLLFIFIPVIKDKLATQATNGFDDNKIYNPEEINNGSGIFEKNR